MDYRQMNAIRKKKEVALDGSPDKNGYLMTLSPGETEEALENIPEEIALFRLHIVDDEVIAS